MRATEFFDLVLPREGLRCIAVPLGTGKGFRHAFRDTNDRAAEFAANADARKATVYHACASYLTNESRKGTNVAKVRSLWLDIDCGPGKPYATQADGLRALVAFVKAVGLPAPLIVSSGVGLHAYWPLDADVDPGTWLTTAIYLKAACAGQGLATDPSRTADVASVLRPPGSHHRKGVPTQVKVLRTGRPNNLTTIHQLLLAYLEAHDLVPAPPAQRTTAFANNADLAGGIVYAPTFSDRIADQCGVVGLVRDPPPAPGKVDQPTWYGVLGVLAKCEDGQVTAHEWSAKDPRYTKAQTQKELDRAGLYPPTTCVKLGEFHQELCKVCPHHGLIRTPSVLGYAPAVSATPEKTAPSTGGIGKSMGFGSDQEAAPVGEINYPWGFTYTDCGAPFFQMAFETIDKDGQRQFHPFCNTKFYPVQRLGDDAEGYGMQIEMVVKSGETRRFVLDTRLIGEGGSGLAGTLGKWEIVALPRMEQKMTDYLKASVTEMKLKADAMAPRDHFGWHGRNFLLGDQMITPTGQTDAVVRHIAAHKKDAFTPAGSLDVWKDVIDTAYNYPGQEALQFCVLLSFAAPLLSMIGVTGGITAFAHSEGSGQGKTTAQCAGLSAWGDWNRLQLSDEQTTQNALWGYVGAYSNLPVLYDELTNQEGKNAAKMVFAMSSGRPKERMNSDGGMRHSTGSWATILMSSGNNMLTEKLAQHRSNASGEIARTFEFTVRSKSRLTPNEASILFPRLLTNYGEAGRLYATFLVCNYEAVVSEITKVRAAFNNEAHVQQEERYWSALAAAVLTALKICRKLKLMGFDISGVKSFLLNQFNANRGGRQNAVETPTEQFGQLLSSIWQGILVTYGQGDLSKGNPAEIFEKREPVGAIVGRAILVKDDDPIEKPSLRISRAAIADWCNKHGVSVAEMRHGGLQAGWLLNPDARYPMGKGCTKFESIASSNVRCWLVDPSKMSLGHHDRLKQLGPKHSQDVPDGKPSSWNSSNKR